MSTVLTRVDTVPFEGNGFTAFFEQWLANLVDSLNEVISQLEDEINRYDNGLIAPQFTTAEITTLALTAANGVMWYDTDTNELKGKINGSVVVIA